MKQLILMRHGKAKRGGIPDFERPLSKRGYLDALLIGAWLSRKSRFPEVILCSPALRTVETLDGLRRHLATIPEPRLLKSLYNAGPAVLLTRIRSVPDTVGTLLVIGHNPGLQNFAVQFAGPYSKERAVRRIGKKFPTAAIASFQADTASWREFGESHVKLIRVVRPSDLR